MFTLNINISSHRRWKTRNKLSTLFKNNTFRNREMASIFRHCHFPIRQFVYIVRLVSSNKLLVFIPFRYICEFSQLRWKLSIFVTDCMCQINTESIVFFPVAWCVSSLPPPVPLLAAPLRGRDTEAARRYTHSHSLSVEGYLCVRAGTPRGWTGSSVHYFGYKIKRNLLFIMVVIFVIIK